MHYLLVLFILIFSSKTFSMEEYQLINEYDLEILFNNNIKKWNETVLFLDKKKSMSKISDESNIYFLKSVFKDGSVTIKPYFNNNLVYKINIYYELNIKNQNLINLILDHYKKLDNNFCINFDSVNKKIDIFIKKCF